MIFQFPNDIYFSKSFSLAFVQALNLINGLIFFCYCSTRLAQFFRHLAECGTPECDRFVHSSQINRDKKTSGKNSFNVAIELTRSERVSSSVDSNYDTPQMCQKIICRRRVSAGGTVKFNSALIERPNDGATFSRVSTISTRRRQQFLAFMLWEDNGVFVCDWRACYSIELNYCSFFIVKVYIHYLPGRRKGYKIFLCFWLFNELQRAQLVFCCCCGIAIAVVGTIESIEIENCWYRR